MTAQRSVCWMTPGSCGRSGVLRHRAGTHAPLPNAPARRGYLHTYRVAWWPAGGCQHGPVCPTHVWSSSQGSVFLRSKIARAIDRLQHGPCKRMRLQCRDTHVCPGSCQQFGLPARQLHTTRIRAGRRINEDVCWGTSRLAVVRYSRSSAVQSWTPGYFGAMGLQLLVVLPRRSVTCAIWGQQVLRSRCMQAPLAGCLQAAALQREHQTQDSCGKRPSIAGSPSKPATGSCCWYAGAARRGSCVPAAMCGGAGARCKLCSSGGSGRARA